MTRSLFIAFGERRAQVIVTSGVLWVLDLHGALIKSDTSIKAESMSFTFVSTC